MEKNNVINYNQKNNEEYKRLAELLFCYHSGMNMSQSDLNVIAQATPQQRIEAMNLLILQKMGINSGYGISDSNSSYEEELGKSLVEFYYGYKENLTKEQLLIIATATDQEKLDVLESYICSHYARPDSSIKTIALLNEERKVSKSI